MGRAAQAAHAPSPPAPPAGHATPRTRPSAPAHNKPHGKRRPFLCDTLASQGRCPRPAARAASACTLWAWRPTRAAWRPSCSAPLPRSPASTRLALTPVYAVSAAGAGRQGRARGASAERARRAVACAALRRRAWWARRRVPASSSAPTFACTAPPSGTCRTTRRCPTVRARFLHVGGEQTPRACTSGSKQKRAAGPQEGRSPPAMRRARACSDNALCVLRPPVRRLWLQARLPSCRAPRRPWAAAWSRCPSPCASAACRRASTATRCTPRAASWRRRVRAGSSR